MSPVLGLTEEQLGQPVDPRVHGGELGAGGGPFKFGAPTWTDREGRTVCSYCGSLSVPEVVGLLLTPGTEFSGTDKTTYKVYVSPAGGFGKFYLRHLRACSDAELAEVAGLFRRVFGLDPKRDAEGNLVIGYPHVMGAAWGWQTFGNIGEGGAPLFKDGSPTPPKPEFWDS